EGGQLTEAVRRKPYSVILFDEIEKAHHDVFNVFLQILDDGRLTDGQGRTVDFKNAVVIMTSNIGSQVITGYAGAHETMRERVLDALREHFRPEFLNRIDDIVVFHALSKAHVRSIVDLQLARLEARLADRHLTLDLTDRAKEHLVERGYDPVYGARPLRRAIQQEVETRLAQLSVAGGAFADLIAAPRRGTSGNALRLRDPTSLPDGLPAARLRSGLRGARPGGPRLPTAAVAGVLARRSSIGRRHGRSHACYPPAS